MDVARFVTALGLLIHNVDSDEWLISAQVPEGGNEIRKTGLARPRRRTPQATEGRGVMGGPPDFHIDQQSGRPRNSRITGESVPRCAPLGEEQPPTSRKLSQKYPHIPPTAPPALLALAPNCGE